MKKSTFSPRYQLSHRSSIPPPEAAVSVAPEIKKLVIWWIGQRVLNAIFNRETAKRR